MMRGWIPFTFGCAVVAALMVIPPDVARWIAIGLLVVVVLTPAVGYKPRRSAASHTRGRGRSDSR